MSLDDLEVFFALMTILFVVGLVGLFLTLNAAQRAAAEKTEYDVDQKSQEKFYALGGIGAVVGAVSVLLDWHSTLVLAAGLLLISSYGKSDVSKLGWLFGTLVTLPLQVALLLVVYEFSALLPNIDDVLYPLQTGATVKGYWSHVFALNPDFRSNHSALFYISGAVVMAGIVVYAMSPFALVQMHGEKIELIKQKTAFIARLQDEIECEAAATEKWRSEADRLQDELWDLRRRRASDASPDEGGQG